MKFKRALSGIMAGIIAITSSVASISPTAFAADDSTWDLPMLSVERASDTVIDSLYVNGWDPFDVDLRSFGIMNEFTTVTITCVTDETGIVGDDKKAPEAAFGVVINNIWDKATMPRCGYNPSETVFEMTLTAERLENNPVFKVQSQLPVRALFTVTVSNLTADNRAAISLAPLSENVTLNTYDASNWMDGGNCYGSVSIPAKNISGGYAITYGETTVRELRENVKYISTSAIPYYGDSLDAGAGAFEYNVAIVCGNGDEVSTVSSEDSFDLTSPGTTYIDSLRTNELDSFLVYEIRIEISAKLFWNGEIEKNQAVSDKIRLAKPNTPIRLEIVEDLRTIITLPAIDEYSMVLTAEEGQDWLIGSYAYADYIVPDPVGKTYGNTTIGDLRKVLKKFNTTANTYVSDSLNAGENNFIYFIDMEANNGEDNIRFGNDSFRLTESGTVYVDNFDYKGTKISSGTYDDYVITAIIIKVQSALGWDDVEKKSFALCEDIRHMNPGDTMTLELAEDTRTAVEVTAPTAPVRINIWTCGEGEGMVGNVFGGETACISVPGVTYGETTIGELCESTKSISTTLPYYNDTVGAGKDAFWYKFVIVAGNTRYYCDQLAPVGETLTVYTDELMSKVNNSNDVINGIYLNIEPAREYINEEQQQAASAVIRGLEEGTTFVYEPVKDTRTDAAVGIEYPAVVELEVFDEESSAGSIAFVQLTGEVKGLTGMKVGEMLETFRSFSVTAPGYYADELNLGSEYYDYQLGIHIVYGNNEEYIFTEKMPMNKDTILYTTAIWCDGLEDYTIDEIFVKIMAATETTEDGFEQSKAEVIRTMKPGDTITLVLNATKPQNVKAEAGDGQVTLTWDEASWATTYYIYSYLGDGQYALLGATSDLSFTATGLTNGQTYQFLVRAFNEIAGSPYELTDLVSATPQSKGLAKPVVTATPGDSQVTLSWNAVPNAITYYIYSYLGDGQYALLGTTSDLSFTAAGLTNGQTYQFLVRAFSATDASPYELTDLVSATPQAKGLAKPVLDITVGDGAVYLSWSVVPNATYYYVYFYNSSTNGFDLYGATTGNGCYVGGLVNGQTYGYLVRAFNDSEGSPYTYDDIVFVTLPAKVTKPVVTATPGDGQVTLSWNDVPNAITYYIYSYLGNGQYALLGTTSDLSFTAAGLTNGQTYQFLVRAFSATEGSPYELTDLVSATPQAKGLAKPVLDITVGDGAVYLSWSVVPNATLYYVYFYNPTINGFDLYGVTTGNGCYVGGLVNGQTYGYLVRAFNDNEGSPYSYADIVFVTPPYKLAKPNVTATPGNGQVTLTWTAIPSATTYYIYSYLGNGQYALLGTTSDLSFTAAGLTSGQEYQFLVRAFSDSDASPYELGDLVSATPA